MVDVFLNYLLAHGSFTSAELERIASVTIVKHLKKRQFLLQQGEVCRYKTFVVSGLLRLYRIGDDASEHVLRFATQNWWITDHESFRSGLPAKGVIDALEDSHLLLWTKENWESLKKEIPAFDALQTYLLSRSVDAQGNRLHVAISYTAEEKLAEFQRSFPDFYRRVPLYMVASYLGVTRETLTRIRKHALNA